MKIKPPKFNKGLLGYHFDFRKQMAVVSRVSKQFCDAFDVGDEEAVGLLADEWREIMLELAATGEAIQALGKQQEGE